MLGNSLQLIKEIIGPACTQLHKKLRILEASVNKNQKLVIQKNGKWLG